MTGTVSCQGKATGLRVMTDIAAVSGTEVHDSGLAAGTHTLMELVETQNIETHEHRLRGTFARSDPLFDASTYGRVWRLDFPAGCFKEFRVHHRRQERGDRGKLAVVECEGIHVDLTERAGIVRQPYANGRLDPAVSLVGVTPTQAIEFVRRNAENFPAWVVTGTVDWTTPIDVQFNRFMAWRALVEIANRTSERVNAPTYLQLLPNGVASYDINLVADPAPGADTVLIQYTQNELTLSEEEVPDKFATRVYVFSGGDESQQIGIEQNLWEVESVAADTVTLLASDSPFGEDDQVNDKFLEKPDGTRTEVTDTTAPRTVVVADASGITAGSLVRFVADAAGTDLDHLDSPSGQAGGIGPVVQIVERPDIPNVVNLAPNPYLVNGTTLPDFWTNPDGMTVTKTTDDSDSRYGLTAWRILGLEGQILETDLHTVRFTDFRRHFYFGTAFWMFTGRLRLEIHDYSFPADPEMHPRIYLPDTAQVQADSRAINTWEELAVFPGRDFFTLGSTQFKYVIRLLQDSDFLLDAWQVEQRETPRSPMRFYAGSAANDLWLVGRDYLRAFNTRPKFYSTRFIDEDRRGFVTGEEVVPGAFAELTDADLDPAISAVSKRIVEAEWDHLHEGNTEVRLEQIPAHLADRFLGRPQPPVRFTIPENVMRPGCPPKLRAWRNPDLQVIWSKVIGAAQYELRIPGDTTLDPSDPDYLEDRWKRGIAIYLGDATNWVLKDGETLTEDARNNPITPIKASEIDELMIETYNRFGVPGECFEVIGIIQVVVLVFDEQPCPNLAPPEAGEEFCSPDTTDDPFLIHTYTDVDLRALGIEEGEGQALTYCFKGKTVLGGEGTVQFFFDFEDQVLGQAPVGWTPRYFAGPGTFVVDSASGMAHGVRVTTEVSGHDHYVLSLDALDDYEGDMEFLYLASLTSIELRTCMGVIFGTSVGACLHGHTVSVNEGFGAGTLWIQRLTQEGAPDFDCVRDTLDQGPTLTIPKREKWWVRARREGGTITARWWRHGTDEHCTWDVTASSTGDGGTGAFYGLYCQGTSQWDRVAIALGGATAFVDEPAVTADTDTFVADTVGAEPSKWDAPFGTPDVWEVVDDEGFPAMRIDDDSGGNHVRFLEGGIGMRQSVTAKIRVEATGGGGHRHGVIARMSGHPGTGLSGAVLRFAPGNIAQTVIIVDGTALASQDSTFTFDAEYVWAKIETDGNFIRSRWWADGDTEPTIWFHTIDNAVLASGWAGIASFSGVPHRCAYFSVQMNGKEVTWCEDPDVRAAIDLDFVDEDGVVISRFEHNGVSAASYTKVLGASALGSDSWGSIRFLRFKAFKKGAGQGIACLKDLQLNFGSSCCEFSSPTTELGDVEVTCLFGVALGTITVDTCAGGGGMSIPVTWGIAEDCEGFDIGFVVEEVAGGTATVIHRERYFGQGSVKPADLSHTIVVDGDTSGDASLSTAVGSDAGDASLRDIRVTVVLFQAFLSDVVDRASVDAQATYGTC